MTENWNCTKIKLPDKLDVVLVYATNTVYNFFTTAYLDYIDNEPRFICPGILFPVGYAFKLHQVHYWTSIKNLKDDLNELIDQGMKDDE